MDNNELKKISCAVTGHRSFVDGCLDYNMVIECIRELYDRGYRHFYNGGAVGFDLYMARATLYCKENFCPDIVFHLCLANNRHSLKFSQENKEIFNRVYSKADFIHGENLHYTSGCYLKRDRFMVDNCSLIISYLRNNEGGTYYTVEYSKKRGLEIIKM